MLGRRVIIVGLVAKPELNGRAGTALHFDGDMGRYSVKLDEPSSMLMQLIKPCNLLPQERAMKDVQEVEAKGKQEAVERKEAEEASIADSQEQEEASISLETAEAESPISAPSQISTCCLLADVAIHSLTSSETELNGRQGVCVDVCCTSMCVNVQHIRSGLMTSMPKRWLVQLPEGRQIWVAPENLTLICSNAACRVNLLQPLLKCSKCKVAL